MDYKKKYLKYKQKYFFLKNQQIQLQIQNGGNNQEYITKLKELYPQTEHLRDDKDYKDNHITYGEITYEGIQVIKEIYDRLNLEYFIDIGSGNGKLPLFMAGSSKIKKSVGIELVEIRHNRAMELKSQLANNFSEITQKVEFINDDFNNVNFSTVLNNNNKPVAVFISNLCFGEEINEKLYKKLLDELPAGTVIIASKKANIANGKKIETILCPMSWSVNSNVFVVYL
jgi:hypothetical protein